MFHSNQKASQKQDSYEAPRDPGRAGAGAGAGSVIGEGTRIEGSITVSGTLRVDGEINGGAVVTTENLSVGAKGSIKADLAVKQALISGTVVGKIRARERVELLAGAHVRGDVYAQSFKIEDGVFFHGTCVMGEAAASEVESASPAMRVIDGGKSSGAGGGASSASGAQRPAVATPTMPASAPGSPATQGEKRAAA